jgi:hypothetical protein
MLAGIVKRCRGCAGEGAAARGRSKSFKLELTGVGATVSWYPHLRPFLLVSDKARQRAQTMARILTERRSCSVGVPCRTSSCGPCRWRRPGQRGSGRRGGWGGGRKQSFQQGRCWRRKEGETCKRTTWQAYLKDFDLVCMARWLRVVTVVQTSGFRVSGGCLALLLLLLLPRM